MCVSAVRGSVNGRLAVIIGVKGRCEIHLVEGLPMNLPCIGGCAGDMWGSCGWLGVLVGGRGAGCERFVHSRVVWSAVV